MDNASQQGMAAPQRASIAKYVLFTFVICIATGVLVTFIQSFIKTPLGFMGLVAFLGGVRFCGQRFYKDHGRAPSAPEAIRYAVWTTLLQFIFGVFALAGIAASDPKAVNDPVFWWIIGSVSLVILIVCFLVARYGFVSSAKYSP
jgi:hypothetical protein